MLLAPQMLLHVDERGYPDVAHVTVVQGHALLVVAPGEVADQAPLARLNAAVSVDVRATFSWASQTCRWSALCCTRGVNAGVIARAPGTPLPLSPRDAHYDC